jgi:hypothetical protein
MLLYNIITCGTRDHSRYGIQRYCKPVILVTIKFVNYFTVFDYIIYFKRWPFWLYILYFLWATTTQL